MPKEKQQLYRQQVPERRYDVPKIAKRGSGAFQLNLIKSCV